MDIEEVGPRYGHPVGTGELFLERESLREVPESTSLRPEVQSGAVGVVLPPSPEAGGGHILGDLKREVTPRDTCLFPGVPPRVDVPGWDSEGTVVRRYVRGRVVTVTGVQSCHGATAVL